MSASSNPAAPPTTDVPRFAALRSHNFRMLWFGLLISNAGTWMSSTAEGWLVTDLEPGRAAFWLGVIAIAFAIPMIVLPPFGGALADRAPRIRLLWVVQTLYLAMSVALAAFTMAGKASVLMLVVYAFGNGVVLAFDSPVRHALLPEIIDRGQLTSGVSLNSVAFTGASLVGPAIAGGLIPLIGVGGVFAVNAVSCVATLLAISRFRGVSTAAPNPSSASGVWDSIRDGIKYVARTPVVGGLILLSTVYGLFARSYGPLLAVFARDVYGVGSGAYGLLISVGGLGTLIGAFTLASRTNVERKGQLAIAAVIAQSVLLLIFALAGSYGAALPALLFVGMLSAVAGALSSTVIQLTVPNELRGRVMSLYILTLVGVPSIGAFLLGIAAELSSPGQAVAGSALIVIVAVVVIAWRNDALRSA